jgi:hypothetical protein
MSKDNTKIENINHGQLHWEDLKKASDLIKEFYSETLEEQSNKPIDKFHTKLTYEVKYPDGKTVYNEVKENIWDCNIEDVQEMLVRLLAGAGWSEKSINELFGGDE